MKNKLFILYRVVAVALLISLCALPVAIAPRDARAAFGDCIAYDTFTRDDGAIGNTEITGPSSEACQQYAWTGGTWAISGNTIVDTPNLENEIMTNGSFSIDTTDWSDSDATLASIAGGQSGNCLEITTSANYGQARQNKTTTIGVWYSFNIYKKNGTTTTGKIKIGTAANSNYYYDSGNINLANWTSRSAAFRGASTTLYINLEGGNSGYTTLFDEASVKNITLSSLFSSINTGSIDGTYSVSATLSSGTQAGLALALNSQSSPTAGIIIYHNGTKLIVDKFTTSTAWTNLISTTATYGTGYQIKADLTASSGHVYLTAYYNNVQIGTQQDITDAAIISNTYHGVFSTYSGNSLDNFYISNNIPNTATPTNTATNTATNTPTASDTPTNTPTDTATNTPTASDTPTNTSTHTATFTNTFTITYTPTETNTSTASKTPTNTFTPTNTATLHYDATTTYEAAYAYYTGIAEQNYPTIIILSVLCGVILLALIVWGIFAYLRRRR